jgi:hypothetical protein
MLKPLLRDFLTWLEGVSMGVCQPGSPFDLPLDPRIVAKAQEAVDLAQASGEEVALFTGGIAPQAIIAQLVFHRAGFGADRIVQGELTQKEGDGLLEAVQTLATCNLVLVEDNSAWEHNQPLNAQTTKSIALSWDV